MHSKEISDSKERLRTLSTNMLSIPLDWAYYEFPSPTTCLRSSSVPVAVPSFTPKVSLPRHEFAN